MPKRASQRVSSFMRGKGSGRDMVMTPVQAKRDPVERSEEKDRPEMDRSLQPLANRGTYGGCKAGRFANAFRSLITC